VLGRALMLVLGANVLLILLIFSESHEYMNYDAYQPGKRVVKTEDTSEPAQPPILTHNLNLLPKNKSLATWIKDISEFIQASVELVSARSHDFVTAKETSQQPYSKLVRMISLPSPPLQIANEHDCSSVQVPSIGLTNLAFHRLSCSLSSCSVGPALCLFVRPLLKLLLRVTIVEINQGPWPRLLL
jgi:hypothetical protein